MSIRLGISGFGRIGRNLLRIGLSQPDLEFVAISDVADLESLAYLFGHGTIEGPYPEPVAATIVLCNPGFRTLERLAPQGVTRKREYRTFGGCPLGSHDRDGADQSHRATGATKSGPMWVPQSDAAAYEPSR